MTVTDYLLLAAGLPLGAFLVLIFMGRRLGEGGRFAGGLATLVAFVSLALSVGALVLFVSKWVDRPAGIAGGGGAGGAGAAAYVEAFTYRWVGLPAGMPQPLAGTDSLAAGQAGGGADVRAGGAAITVGVLVDSLTVALFMLVTLLSTVVHVFSLGYMAAEPRNARFFALLNLLSFAMLGLLLANSLIQLFVFWQLVAIAAYFLVNFEGAGGGRRGPVIASLRGFIFNRLGDAAFLAAIGILLAHTGAGGIAELSFFDAQGSVVLTESIRDTLGVRSSEFLRFSGEGFLGLHWLTWTGICFLIAALVRAGQFPFYAWLEDSAEAPAPVAALLQTCTLVASAVVLLARVYPILTLDTRLILAVVGCVSLFFAALVACVQTDIRRILAWSTTSQIGYVFLFLGAGGYMAGLLHLFTHAFFKAGLLLAAGTVVQALRGETDLRQMGGLWKRLPITAAGSLIVVLALASVPWLSGSYSENIGLARVYDYACALRGTVPTAPASLHVGGAPEMLLFWLPVLATYVTAFGIGRWWWLIFVSQPRNVKLLEEAHESPLGTLPLIILAGFSVGFWFEFFGILQFITRSLPGGGGGTPITPSPADIHADTAFQAVAPLTGLAVSGVAVAFFLYFTGMSVAERLRRLPGLNVVNLWLRERLYLDALFEGVLLNGVLLASQAVMIVDRYILSAALRLAAFLAEATAHLAARIDAWLDRPVKRLALKMAPRLHRWLPAPPTTAGSMGAAGESTGTPE